MGEAQIVTIGDLYLDTVVDLAKATPPARFTELTASSNCFSGWSRQAGGSALQVARAALAAGFARATCVGALGSPGGEPDAAAREIANYAQDWGVTLAVAYVPDATGEVLVVYDANGTRLMISNRGANALLNPRLLVPAMHDAVRTATAVHISGYTLLQPARWRSVRALLHTARAGDALVALDLAPHNLHRLMRKAEVLEQIIDMDCLMVEAPLLRRLAAPREVPPDAPTDVPFDVSIDEAILWGASRFPLLVVQLTPDEAVIIRDGRVVDRRRFAYESGIGSRGQSGAAQAELLAEMTSR
jgi:sugar/nucleoside kinase (ribokinase family)